jgi:hypothetical protein
MHGVKPNPQKPAPSYNTTGDSKATGTTEQDQTSLPTKPLTFHHIYFLLAAFDLLTVAISLGLSHKIHSVSVAKHYQ